MSADLKPLVARKTALKSALTRFKNKVNACGESDEELQELQARLEAILPTLKELENVSQEIKLLNDNLDLEKEVEDFENDYFKYTSLAKQKVEKSNRNSNQTTLIDERTTSVLEDNSVVDRSFIVSRVKLPSIDLPEFSGSSLDWQPFYEAFTGLIGDNDTLSEIQKFHYLNSCLKGEAKNVIHSLQITAANYSVALDLIKRRYENKRIIVQSHVKAIVDLAVIRVESHASLRKFVDNIQKNLRALKALKEPVDSWDTLLLYLLSSKLDAVTRKEWEARVNASEVPKMDEFLEFINKRSSILEAVESRIPNQRGQRPVAVHVATPGSCIVCNEAHFIQNCEKFKTLSHDDKHKKIRELRVCINCLRSGHMVRNCRARGCLVCGRKHNTALHMTQVSSNHNQGVVSASADTKQVGNCNSELDDKKENTRLANIANAGSSSSVQSAVVYLSTAVVDVVGRENRLVRARVLLDSGAQTNFVTHKLADQLKMPIEPTNTPITGINGAKTNIESLVKLKIKSRNGSFQKTLSFLVIKNITGRVPQFSLGSDSIVIPDSIPLADEGFDEPGDIDMLLGNAVVFDLLRLGKIGLGKGKPTLRNTSLGWIVSGELVLRDARALTCLYANCASLERQLERFWIVEECMSEQPFNRVEQECESKFTKEHSREPLTGRFVVKLPKHENKDELGESLSIARRGFMALERKLNRNADLKNEYHEFMRTYESMGHMVRLENPEMSTVKTPYYLPHHAVFKPDSQTTRVRVVYNASSKTSTGLSLNDILMVGPSIQPELWEIVVRFRQYEYVKSADICKMYRQIMVEENDRDLQRILWRYNSDEPIAHYKLCTVTYGTASASYLATRCLRQLAMENQNSMPIACDKILSSFYMDDFCGGSNEVGELLNIRDALIKILAQGGFQLRKFASNQPVIMQNFPEQVANEEYLVDAQTEHKILGIMWNSTHDYFSYKLIVPKIDELDLVTKRHILARIAEIFDPLGVLGPVIVTLKLLIQKLWKEKTSWDTPVSPELRNQWVKLIQELPAVENLKFKRQCLVKSATKVQVHFFCDASEVAYGACCYVRSENARGDRQISLLCAKSRVAPLKMLTLPRLELCGGLLMAKLANKVLRTIDFQFDNVYYWTDSTIVLSWLALESRQLKTFVGNRISQIQQLCNINRWYHVASRDNPADVISRGLHPNQFLKAETWLDGPSFLKGNLDAILELKHISRYSAAKIDVPELNLKYRIALPVQTTELDICSKFASFKKLRRVIAYCLRFVGNLRSKDRKFGTLSAIELERSEHCLVKAAQEKEFAREIRDLKTKGQIPPNSSISSLDPFFDTEGILRVGGRLRKSNLEYAQRHPILLPKACCLTKLIIIHEHERNFHSGQQATLCQVRQKYWQVHGSRVIRNYLRKCIICYRSNPIRTYAKMGDLPNIRTTPARIFSSVAVDYCGPFQIKERKFRNKQFFKGYVCIFVCLFSKAVHLELVTELSTVAFISMFSRFVSRRGMVQNVYSDNGTNFVGASNEFKSILADPKLKNYISENNFEWHFNPPATPHFTGLAEAAVKSFKGHFKRVTKSLSFTYEELYSLIVQIEGILNSRPLVPISSDPKDLEALTPGHFIIGQALTALPQRMMKDSTISFQSRYKHIQMLVQHFWKRWSREYLHTQQQRWKWKFDSPDSKMIGALVLIHEDNLPPQSWKLARIEELHAGTDGVVRVLTLRTAKGLVRRSVVKVCLLPITEDS